MGNIISLFFSIKKWTLHRISLLGNLPKSHQKNRRGKWFILTLVKKIFTFEIFTTRGKKFINQGIIKYNYPKNNFLFNDKIPINFKKNIKKAIIRNRPKAGFGCLRGKFDGVGVIRHLCLAVFFSPWQPTRTIYSPKVA